MSKNECTNGGDENQECEVIQQRQHGVALVMNAWLWKDKENGVRFTT